MRFEDEKELENLILAYYKKNDVTPITDDGYDHFLQQVQIRGYGTIDLLGISIHEDPGGVNVDICIYELKNRKIDEKDVSQIARYHRGVSRYLERFFGANFDSSHSCSAGDINFTVTGILVGSGYNNGGDVCYLVDSIPWLYCYTFKIFFDGVKFEEESGWFNKEEPTDIYHLGGIDFLDEISKKKEIYKTLMKGWGKHV